MLLSTCGVPAALARRAGLVAAAASAPASASVPSACARACSGTVPALSSRHRASGSQWQAGPHALAHSCRAFASSSQQQRPSSDPAKVPPAAATGETVALDHEHYPAPADAAQDAAHGVSAIVVCHGLFGSKQNWRSLGRAMAKRFGVPVYALDLRNHGTSPHIAGLAYADMAADVLRFLQDHNLRNIMLIGHSMGGKVVQALALDPHLPKDALKCLVSVDIAAARGPISKEFEQYIDAMLEIQGAKLTTRAEADKMLSKTEPDLGIRQFLLTNLQRVPADSNTWSFRVPLENIRDHISQIGDFPYDAEGVPLAPDGKARESRTWEGKTLFVKGSKSKYINSRNIPICKAYFPNSSVVTLDTGHWVQAEKPNEFVLEMEKFLKS